MAAIKVYPLLFEPVLKHYIWGGRNLERLFGRTLPPGDTAESWEIAGHEDGTTKVLNGHFAGMPLTALQAELGLDLIGSRNKWAHERGKFPLLIKLLDANRPLSVQVHPNDEYALANEGNELGKTEMWVVLHADPDAELILGLEPGFSSEQFRRGIEEGDLEPFLQRVPIKAGDAICVPAGTVHAILAGTIIAEIQQNSNTTYRVYDWNRVDTDGNSRPLHVEKALDVIDFAAERSSIANPQMVYSDQGIKRLQLCSNSYFTTERVEMSSGAVYRGNCDGSTLEIWGAVEGEAVVGDVSLERVQFALLPASLGEFTVQAPGDCTLLRTFVD